MEIKYTTPNDAPYWIKCISLFDAPHLLIGGTTGSGKSTLLHSILWSAIGCRTPKTTKLVLIDPKKVELIDYKDIPHTIGYCDESHTVLAMLGKVVKIIDQRFKEMQSLKAKKYDGCHIYVVIDELADLMTSPLAKEIKMQLQRISQIGRAANVHLICATQCPNRKIIPAELVLNFTDRVALRCMSPIESRQLLGMKGAECLPTYGYGLWRNGNGIEQIGIPLTDAEDENARLEFWKLQKESLRM